MPTLYKSKIGIEIVIPLIIIFCTIIFLSRDGYSIWLVLSLAPAVVFIVYLLRSTYYIVDGTSLQVKSGFLVNKIIDINSITKISETTNLLSAPATSLDRLEISYGNSQSVLISPEDKIKFIEELKSINPSINIVFKK